MKAAVLYARSGYLHPIATAALAAMLGAPVWASVAAGLCMAAVIAVMHCGGKRA